MILAMLLISFESARELLPRYKFPPDVGIGGDLLKVGDNFFRREQMIQIVGFRVAGALDNICDECVHAGISPLCGSPPGRFENVVVELNLVHFR